MRNTIRPLRLLPATLLVCIPLTAVAGYIEDWNDPAVGANNWFYFQDGATGEAIEGDVAMERTGGAGWGYVSTDLSQASDWNQTSGFADRYFAYTWNAYHSIDLTVDPFVNLMLRTDGDLSSVDIRFWIGEWTDDANYGFYAFRTSLAVGMDWTLNSIETNDADWDSVLSAGVAPTVTELLSQPEQWGFAVYGTLPTTAPTIDIDWIQISDTAVPLPPTPLLVAPVLLWLLRRRRWA
jgi:hypothetical protein